MAVIQWRLGYLWSTDTLCRSADSELLSDKEPEREALTYPTPQSLVANVHHGSWLLIFA